MEEQAQREMPKYRCFKEVWALKIKDIQQGTVVAKEHPYGSYTITPEDEGFAPFDVPAEFVERHKPQPGGYYVVYEGGYKSFSPAKAFEEGYMLTRLIPKEPEDLVGKIAKAINSCSRENGSNTPDFILAEYLCGCLASYEHATQMRSKWYGQNANAGL